MQACRIPRGLKLFHVPGAGYDSVDLDALPPQAIVCNCFGHEQAIAEYVMAALLARHVPLADADRRLRERDWAYWAGAADRVHDEIAGKTIGLLGFGHIGKAIAARAKAFEMEVLVANRSPVPISDLVDRSFTLERLGRFLGCSRLHRRLGAADPRNDGHRRRRMRSRAMQPSARARQCRSRADRRRGGAVRRAARQRIAGAVIDTWYRYPTPGQSRCRRRPRSRFTSCRTLS